MKALHLTNAFHQAKRRIVLGFNHVCTLLFGPRTPTLIDGSSLPVLLPLPEGDYIGSLTFFTCRWKRPGFPGVERRYGAKVVVDAGIPVPDHDDAANGEHYQSAAISISTRELTVQEALCDVIRSIQDYRTVCGGKDWQPKAVAK